MPGLQLGVMGGVNSGRSQGTGYGASGPVTATEAAFGPGYSQPGTPSIGQALFPNDPFGIAFWTGVVSLGLLMLIRHSLPA